MMIRRVARKNVRRKRSGHFRRDFRRMSLENLETRTLLSAEGLWFDQLLPFDLAAGEAGATVARIDVEGAPVRALNIVFSQAMDLEAMLADGSVRAAVSLVNLASGGVDLARHSFVYDAAAQTLTLSSATPLKPGIYELRLDGSRLLDTGGIPLQGGAGGLVFSLPEYAAGEKIQVGTAAIDVDSYSVPALVDWNSDGVLDLIVGEKTASGAGKVRVYLNTGSAEAPVFEAFFYAQQEGEDLSVASSGCQGAFPRVFDWDGDGRPDLVVGLSDGRVQVFLNVNTRAEPIFGESSFVQVGLPGAKADLDVGSRATPHFVDWNNDGREDLVVGAMDGRVRVYLNQAESGPPEFTSELVLRDGDVDLTVPSGRSSVEVIDLNRDGRKDLVLGNTDGQLFFFPNLGTDNHPEFSGSERIAAAGSPVDLPGSPRSRPFVGSLEPNGPPELWIGEETGAVYRYPVLAWPEPAEGPMQPGASGGTFAFRFQAPASPWQNPLNPLDVNHDQFVAPLDALCIINELNDPTWHDNRGRLAAFPQAATQVFYYDTNGDGYCAPLDALLVINHLNAPSQSGEGEAPVLAVRDQRSVVVAGIQGGSSAPLAGQSAQDRLGSPAVSGGDSNESSVIPDGGTQWRRYCSIEPMSPRASAESVPPLRVSPDAGTLDSLLTLLAADRQGTGLSASSSPIR